MLRSFIWWSHSEIFYLNDEAFPFWGLAYHFSLLGHCWKIFWPIDEVNCDSRVVLLIGHFRVQSWRHNEVNIVYVNRSILLGKDQHNIGFWVTWHFSCVKVSSFLFSFIPSVTRFGEISPLWLEFTSLCKIFDGLFIIWLLWQICDILG